MRRDEICDRSRADVRIRVTVDGRVLYQQAHHPSGLYADMNSIGVVHVPMSAGAHALEVSVGDTHDASEWSYHGAQRMDFPAHGRHVVVFDRTRGFQWF
ncbi:MAG TPA: hypothetical protein VF331_10955 [Polyangiales bacterium]